MLTSDVHCVVALLNKLIIYKKIANDNNFYVMHLDYKPEIRKYAKKSCIKILAL